MDELTPYLRGKLGLADDVDFRPEVSLETLGVTREQAVALLDKEFPLIIGWGELDAAARTAMFSVGMDHVVDEGQTAKDREAGVEFGAPWTVQRLCTLFQRCVANAYPENGSM